MRAYQLLSGIETPAAKLMLSDIPAGPALFALPAPSLPKLPVGDVVVPKENVDFNIVALPEELVLDMPPLEGDNEPGKESGEGPDDPDETIEYEVSGEGDSDSESEDEVLSAAAGSESSGRPRVPADFPDVWPPRYNPKYLGRKRGRDYLCRFPGCSAIISRKDPSWTHVARHMGLSAKCPKCGKGYQDPASFRLHLRGHKF
jgi:hypothetical protein